MKTLIISGKKESGKTSAARFIHGYVMQQKGTLSKFDITPDGKLLVNTMNGQDDVMGELDIERRDETFLDWMSYNVWPYIKLYNFADRLKQSLHYIFNVPWDALYKDKNLETAVKWKDMFSIMPPRTVAKLKKTVNGDQLMRGRELCQQWGSLCRLIDENCWVDRCVEQIQTENPEIAIIGDCRYPNEVLRAKMYGAKTMRLKRVVDENDTHSSETALDDWADDKFDWVIDNQNMSILEKNFHVLDCLQNWGWV